MNVPRKTDDATYKRLFEFVMHEVFNAATVGDFVVYDTKNKRFTVNGQALTPEQAKDVIAQAQELKANVFFQMLLAQLTYDANARFAKAADWDAAVFPKGILYASDLIKRVVDEVSNLTVAK